MENPKPPPILKHLNKIEDEIHRLKAIEQAAKDFIRSSNALKDFDYATLENPLATTNDPLHAQNISDWKNLQNLCQP